MLRERQTLHEQASKMYGDTNWQLNSATKAMPKYQQSPNKSVWDYANHLKAKCRRAGWNLIRHEVVLYDMAWAALWHVLQTNVRPWMSSGKEMFDTLDQLSDCTAAPEFKPDDKTPGGKQQQEQSHESQKGGNEKHNVPPSVCQPATKTSGITNNSNNTGNSKSGKSKKPSGSSSANITPAQWLSKEVY